MRSKKKFIAKDAIDLLCEVEKVQTSASLCLKHMIPSFFQIQAA